MPKTKHSAFQVPLFKVGALDTTNRRIACLVHNYTIADTKLVEIHLFTKCYLNIAKSVETQKLTLSKAAEIAV
jgi:hypothetical protein